MRQLPSASVDLIYIDPPFFSNRQYNVIWGDQNEERSFSDIWEGGLDGYLVWLNARLYEMKRLLKPTGSIYVHCDWHASHYIKVEMDKIFGYENFRNEISWCYAPSGRAPKYGFHRKHDAIHYYTNGSIDSFHHQYTEMDKRTLGTYNKVDNSGRSYKESPGGRSYLDHQLGRPVPSWWTDIPSFGSATNSSERVGYPTQKPEALVERIIQASSNPGDLVLDAFCGGGGTGVVAQRLGRRWIMIDQSRGAVSVTAERIKNDAVSRELGGNPLPDFTTEQWGIYEAEKLSAMPAADFRQFILHCYDARVPSDEPGVHGYKGAQARIPVWVGSPNRHKRVTADDVNDFAQAITRLERYRGDDGLRDGTMLAWAFTPEARAAAQLLREREELALGMVRLEQVALESNEFRAHIASRSTERGDYSEFLTFVQPPQVEITHQRVRGRTYNFSAADTQIYNVNAQLSNVQWDFDHRDNRFIANRDTWFGKRTGKGKNAQPPLDAQHTFPHSGTFTVACKVQDDTGGEALGTIQLHVS